MKTANCTFESASLSESFKVDSVKNVYIEKWKKFYTYYMIIIE
jgi:hypothetical protein